MAGQASNLPTLLRALGSPVRIAIVREIEGAGESCPTELSERLGESVKVVAYHVRKLADAGVIELRGTDRRRGGVQHWYASRFPGLVGRIEAAVFPRGKG